MTTLAAGVCRITELECKSVLSKSRLADYAVNCYTGCEHGCCYCYARFVTRASHPKEPWGSFVDVKVNAPAVLAREAKRKRVGRVFISSVCDGWQPRETSYRLTRQCLGILLHYGYPVTILTKSALASYDLDLLTSSSGVDFGVTVTTLNESLRQLIEPRGSPSTERLMLLEEARRKGIKTYAFLGPLLPYLSDTEESLTPLLKAVGDAGVSYFYVDRLNPRFGVWPSLRSLLQRHFPHLLEAYRNILFNASVRIDYTEGLMSTVSNLVRRHGLDGKMRLCF